LTLKPLRLLGIDMTGKRITIIDLTGEIAQAGEAANDCVQIFDDFALPYRVAISKADGQIQAFAGKECEGLHEDRNTLIFDHLNLCLPGMADENLLSLVITSFWNTLSTSLSAPGASGATAYIITDYRYPASLLERFRALCKVNAGLHLAGFISEEAAFLMGFINTEAFGKRVAEVNASRPVTFCAVAASDEREVVVACFDYWIGAKEERYLVIRDFFRARFDLLIGKLESRDWRNQVSQLLSIEAADLPGSRRTWLEKAIHCVRADACRITLERQFISRLKLDGAARIARCRRGRGSEQDNYNIETAYNIGVQIEQGRFHPISTRQSAASINQFPFTVAQAFHVRGKLGTRLNLNFYCGRSDIIEDSTQIASITLSEQETAALSKSPSMALAVRVRMDTRGSGEVALERLPDNGVIASQAFTLPGLVI
jgi:hypothetical protein